MSHISGTYAYNFVRLEPFFNNSAKTGISSLVVGMSCQFSGVDALDNPVTESAYIDGTTGFSFSTLESGLSGSPIWHENNLTPSYVADNINSIANDYSSGLCWCHSLSGQISSKIESPVRDTDFPYPSGMAPDIFPPVDPHDM